MASKQHFLSVSVLNCLRIVHVIIMCLELKKKKKKFGLSDKKMDLMTVLLHCQTAQLMWRIFCARFCDFMTRGTMGCGLLGHTVLH